MWGLPSRGWPRMDARLAHSAQSFLSAKKSGCRLMLDRERGARNGRWETRGAK